MKIYVSDPVDDLAACEHPARIAHEELEQLELARRHGYGLAVDRDLVAFDVHASDHKIFFLVFKIFTNILLVVVLPVLPVIATIGLLISLIAKFKTFSNPSSIESTNTIGFSTSFTRGPYDALVCDAAPPTTGNSRLRT